MTATVATPANIDAVRRFNRFFTSRIGVLAETLVESQFTLGEARVLYELAHCESTTTSELSRTLGLDAGYLSRMLTDFVGRALVSRQRSKEDGRQWHLALTKKGARTFAPLEQRTKDDVTAMLNTLTNHEQRTLVAAMAQIEQLLSNDQAAKSARAASPIVLRAHRPGDMGWITYRQALIYNEEFGWNEEYEALIAEIMAKFLREFDPKWERCWVAEQDGEIVGSVFVVRKSPTIAQLRLLYVEPRTRGMGLGRQLVDECVRFSKQKKYETLTLWTMDSLTSARKIYEAAGFEIIAQERNQLFGKEKTGQHWDLDLRRLRGAP